MEPAGSGWKGLAAGSSPAGHARSIAGIRPSWEQRMGIGPRRDCSSQQLAVSLAPAPLAQPELQGLPGSSPRSP